MKIASVYLGLLQVPSSNAVMVSVPIWITVHSRWLGIAGDSAFLSFWLCVNVSGCFFSVCSLMLRQKITDSRSLKCFSWPPRTGYVSAATQDVFCSGSKRFLFRRPRCIHSDGKRTLSLAQGPFCRRNRQTFRTKLWLMNKRPVNIPSKNQRNALRSSSSPPPQTAIRREAISFSRSVWRGNNDLFMPIHCTPYLNALAWWCIRDF